MKNTSAYAGHWSFLVDRSSDSKKSYKCLKEGSVMSHSLREGGVKDPRRSVGSNWINLIKQNYL